MWKILEPMEMILNRFCIWKKLRLKTEKTNEKAQKNKMQKMKKRCKIKYK